MSDVEVINLRPDADGKWRVETKNEGAAAALDLDFDNLGMGTRWLMAQYPGVPVHVYLPSGEVIKHENAAEDHPHLASEAEEGIRGPE